MQIRIKKLHPDAALPVYAKAMEMGLGDSDTAAVCAALEKMAGVTRKRGKRR